MCYTDNLYSAKWDRKKQPKKIERMNVWMKVGYLRLCCLFVSWYFFYIFYGLKS